MNRSVWNWSYFICGLGAALAGAFSPPTLLADTLTVDSTLSSVTIGIGVGVFGDDEGNYSNPVTGNPYAPGDLNPDDGTPVTFTSFGNGIGQGDPLVPPSVIPGGVVPITSTGLTAALNGTVSLTPGGFTIDSANVGLNSSGLWQPGNVSPGDATGPPAAADLGAYIDLGALIPGQYVLATLSGTLLSVNTSAPVMLDGLGNFDDPNGTLNLLATTIKGFAAGALNAPISTTTTNQSSTTDLAGNYSGGVLTLPINAVTNIDLSSTGLTGLYAQITENGNIVATPGVPEPATVSLLGFGLVALLTVRRRMRKGR